MNIDARPICYQTTMLLWLARFLQRLARIDLPDPGVGTLLVSPWVRLAIVLLVALLLFARPSGTLRAAVLVGAGTSLALLTYGFLVPAAFAYAGLDGAPDARAMVGPVDAADLVGAYLGSLVARLIVIPMLGLPATAMLAAVVAGVALLVV